MEKKNIIKSVALIAVVFIVGLFVVRGIGGVANGQTAQALGTCTSSNVKVYSITPTDSYVSNISPGQDAAIADFAVVNKTKCDLDVDLGSLTVLNISPNNTANFSQANLTQYVFNGGDSGFNNAMTYNASSKRYSFIGPFVVTKIKSGGTAIYRMVAYGVRNTNTISKPDMFALLLDSIPFKNLTDGTSFKVQPQTLLPREFMVQPGSSLACAVAVTLNPTSPSGAQTPGLQRKLQVSNLASNSACDVEVRKISFDIVDQAIALSYLSNFTLYDDVGNLYGKISSATSMPITFVLSPYLQIPKNTSKIFVLYADVKTSIPTPTKLLPSVVSLYITDLASKSQVTNIFTLPLLGNKLDF